MAEEKKKPDAPAIPPEPPAAKAPKPSEVRVVLADGSAVSAEILRANKNGLVDLTFIHRGESVLITSSPLDPTGKQPDSHHFVADE